MPYRVDRDAHGGYAVALTGEPPYCHALAAGVPAREPELGRGWWLVLAFAVWSAPDVAAVQHALEAARRLGGAVSLGVRPYDDPAELQPWWPEADPDVPGPFWVLLRDGEVVQSRTGRVNADELERWVRAGAGGSEDPGGNAATA